MKNSPVWRAYGDLWKQKKSLLPVNILSDIVNALRPFVYIIFPAKILDELSGRKDPHTLILLALSAVLLNSVLLLLSYWLSNLNMENSDLSGMIEKNRVTEKLLRIDFPALEDSGFVKKVMQHRSETSQRGGVYHQCLWVMETNVTSVLSILLAVVAIRGFWPTMFINAGNGTDFTRTPWLGAAVIAGTALACLLISFVGGRVGRGNAALREDYAKIDRIFEHYSKMLSDYKTGKEIRIFKEQPFIRRQATDELLTRGLKLQSKISGRSAVASGLGAVVFSVLAFGFYLLVGVKARTGLLGLGDMVIGIGGLLQIAQAMRNMAEISGKLREIEPKARLYYEILDMPARSEEQGKPLPTQGKHTLTCQNVGFRYAGSSDFAIRGLNIQINPGDRIAVVGENGSGKTTFIKLLCRLHDPSEGSILLDGRDIREYDEQAYQSLFAVVFQDYQIFALPLGENVAAGGNIDRCRAREMLEKVGFPRKYDLDTMLYRDCDENGVELSGGEAQKLALARALYQDAPLIVLDEPTSALDPYAEFGLYSQFNEMVGDKTAVYISHRLSSCRFCDKVAVFDHGRLTQFGTHEDLLKDRSGRYYALWNAQAKYYVSPESDQTDYM